MKNKRIDINLTAQVSFRHAKKKHPAAVALGKMGGSKTSEAKRRSSASNGLLGGRPKKILE